MTLQPYKMAKQPTKHQHDYTKEHLEDLESQLNDIRTYFRTNSWMNEEYEKKTKEQKFQADLFNNYLKWLEEYMKLSKYFEFFEENSKARESEARKGFEKNITMDIFKDNILTPITEDE